MKSSLFLVAASALLASASPLKKRAYITDWVTETEYVTVYDDCTSTPTSTATATPSAPNPVVFYEAPKITPPPAAVPDAPHQAANYPVPAPPPPAPVVKAPEVKAPAPVVKAPEVKAPEVKAPAPVVKAPEVKAPAPVVQAPEVKAPAPVVQAPEVKAPAPVVQAPEVKAPAPVVQAPEVKIPEVKIPEIKVPVFNVPEVKAQAPKVTPAPKPAPQPAPATNNNLNAYQKRVIEQHTLHRGNHSIHEPMEWDDTLAQYALNTANSCVFEHDMKQGNGGYGQNLASMGTTEDIDGQEVKYIADAITNQWYNGEINSFEPFFGLSDPPSSIFEATGHVTQVLWKGTRKVGCATVKCAAGTIFSMHSQYSVCNYYPPGNYAGEYKENVFPPIGLGIAVV
ncbi:hypothetical protein E4U21_004462 [Claviceps maximensis]|nr:hypothetical protein E4U21_004462 [Claviceps maximensis]